MNKAGGSGGVEKWMDSKGWGKVDYKKIKVSDKHLWPFPSIHSLPLTV